MGCPRYVADRPKGTRRSEGPGADERFEEPAAVEHPAEVRDLVAVSVLGGEAHTGAAGHRARPAGQRGIRTEGRQHRLLHFDALVTCSADDVGREGDVVGTAAVGPDDHRLGIVPEIVFGHHRGHLDGDERVAR